MKTKNTIDPIKQYVIDNIKLKNFTNFICSDSIILDEEIGEALLQYAPEYILKDTDAIEKVNRHRPDLLTNLVAWSCVNNDRQKYAKNLLNHASEVLLMPSCRSLLIKRHTDIFYENGYLNNKDFLLECLKDGISINVSRTVHSHDNDVIMAIVEHQLFESFHTIDDDAKKNNVALYNMAAEKPFLALSAVRDVYNFDMCESLYNDGEFYLTAFKHSKDISNIIPPHIVEQDLPFFETVVDKYSQNMNSLSDKKDFLMSLKTFCNKSWSDENICICMDLLKTWTDGDLYCTSNELLELFKNMAHNNELANCIIKEHFETAFYHLEEHAIDEYRGSTPVENYLQEIIQTWNKYYLESILINSNPLRRQRKI